MKEIQLTQGHVALVDDADLEFLSQWRWHAFLSGSRVYACRNSPFDAKGKRTHIFMHRVVAGTPEGLQTDHINGITLDNRRCNLRAVSRTQNMWNRAPNRRGSSSHKGVSWHKQHGKWCASIQVNKRRIFLGLFTSEHDAAKAYSARAAIEFGEYHRGATI